MFCTSWCNTTMISWISFPFLSLLTTVPKLESFILKWWASAADLNLQYIASNSTFPCNVMTLLLGSTSNIISGTSYGSPGVTVYGIALNTKIHDKSEHFVIQYTIYWRHELLIQRRPVSRRVLGELTSTARGGSYKIIKIVQYLQLILCSFILHLYVYLTGNGSMYSLCLCASVLLNFNFS